MKPGTELSAALNGICAYFTMFPLDFPKAVLAKYAEPGDYVLDPFCGRGTTNFASRLHQLPSIGIDSNPVAVAIAQAKLANTSPLEIVAAATELLDEVGDPQDVPEGEFWELAFAPDVLRLLCRFREALIAKCDEDARIALRAILLGALHGPRPRSKPSYFSNQSPRTYAPKPQYAVRFWKQRGLRPESVDVMDIIRGRALRYYSSRYSETVGRVILGDSRDKALVTKAIPDASVTWVITSPPYYGMRTYIPDQWLRNWFMGGNSTVEYSADGQLSHASKDRFASDLRQVWENVSLVCAPDAKLVVRFGAINDRKVDPLTIVASSFEGTPWCIHDTFSAGAASAGKRQATQIRRVVSKALEEYDVWATLCG